MSTSDYFLLLRDRTGTELARIVDFQNLTYINHRNLVGTCRFDLRENNAAVSLFEDKCQLEVGRRNKDLGVDWYVDYYGIVRSLGRSKSDHTMFNVYAPGLLHMLTWRLVAYKANTGNQSTFSSCAAESIMKQVVNYNCTSLAASGAGASTRERDGIIAGLSVQTNTACGAAMNWDCAWASVLRVCQSIAKSGSGDFNIVKTGSYSWDFRYYKDQLGTDKSASLVFSTEQDNMGNPVKIFDRSDERTIAIVGGEGREEDRDVEIRTGTNFVATTNDIEGFADARNYKATATFRAFGDKKLAEWEARAETDFNVIQTESAFYGKDYFVGDKAKVVFDDDTAACMIVDSATIRVHNDGKDTVEIGMESA